MVSRIDEMVYDNIDATVISASNGKAVDMLYDSAREQAVAPLCLSVAKELERLKDKGKVFLTTGFPIMHEDRVLCETDGPLGLVRLAYGLSLMGIETVIITGELYAKPLLKLINSQFSNAKFMIIKNERKMGKRFKDILNEHKPDMMIAVESPGRSYDNRYYDMSGGDITDYVTPFDLMFEMAHDLNIKTVGIGDGGNEIGMGLISDTVKRYIKNGDEIASKVKTDYLIVGNTSNWGSYGLLAALSNLLKKPLLLNGKIEETLLKKCANLGLVDGILKKIEPSVDGFNMAENKEIILKLIKETNFDELACWGITK